MLDEKDELTYREDELLIVVKEELFEDKNGISDLWKMAKLKATIFFKWAHKFLIM